MVRITGLDDAQVTAWEERLEAQVVASLQDVMDRLARRIERAALAQVASARVLVAADGADLTPPEQTGQLAIPAPQPAPAIIPPSTLPPGQPYVTPTDLATIPPMWQQAVAEQILPLVAQVFIDSAGHIRSQLLDAVPPGGVLSVPALGSRAAEEYLRQSRKTFDQIGDHLWATARGQMSEGFEAGESIPQLADRLRASAGLSARSSVLVARTSVIEASNFGSISMARASGLEMEKEWIATPDLRTRPTHLAADGQRVPLGDPFIVGGFRADFPADPSLPPSERYRCRCTQGYVMPDRAPALPSPTIDQAMLPGTSRSAIEGLPDLTSRSEEGSLTQFYPKAAGPEPFEGEAPIFGTDPRAVRPSLVRAGTPAELQRVWQDELRAISGRDIVVDALPASVSPLTAREYAEATLQMMERYPEALLSRIAWEDVATPEYAWVYQFSHTMTFNERWASEAMRRKYLAQLRSDVAKWDEGKIGWSVRGASTPQATVYHEFYHILDIETLGRSMDRRVMQLVERRAALEGISADDLIARDISAYAGSSVPELIAEAGTNVALNGGQASLISREIVDLLDAEYRAKGFGIRTGPARSLEEMLGLEGEQFPRVGGWAPGGWRAAPLDKAREEIAEREFQIYVRNQEQFGLAVDDDYGRHLGRGIAQQELPDSARAYANGPYTIVVRDGANVSDDALRAAQNQIDALLETQPLDGRPFIFRLGGKATSGTAAQAGADGISIYGELSMEIRGTKARSARFLMPSSAEQPKIVYDLTHEYGHAHMTQDWARSARARSLYDELGLKRLSDEGHIVPTVDTLGYYGAEDYLEAYAEAFAEWNLSAGLTENAMVLRYAREFGWRDPLAEPGIAFPKAAAPKPISRMTVAELRAEARARGVEVPAGVRKADLVRALQDAPPRSGATLPVPVTRAPAGPRLTAAQRRQALIDDRRKVTEALSDIDQLVANGASERALAARAAALRTTLGQGAAADELAPLLDAMASGKGVRAAADELADRAGLTLLGGRSGEVVRFDAKVMDAGGAAISPGTPVLVSRPGFKVKIGREQVVTTRAQVLPASADEIAAFERKATRAAARARAGEIAQASGTARLLADVDQLIARKASRDAIRQALDPALIEAEQLYAGADRATLDALRAALDTGDTAKLRAAVTRASTAAKVKPIGRAGAKAKFDPATMTAVGDVDIPAGASVIVERRGATLAGLTDPLARAQVRLDLPKLRFDAKAAQTFTPKPVVRKATIVEAPPGKITEITAPDGTTMTFKGSWVRVEEPGQPGKFYGSDLDAWRAMYTEVPGEAGSWVKVAPVKAYRYEGEPRILSTIIDGDVEKLTVVREGDYVVRQVGGEVQRLTPDQFDRLYAQAAKPAAPIKGGAVVTDEAYASRQATLTRTVKHKPTEQPHQLGGGTTSDVTLETYGDDKVVRKVYGRRVPATRKADVGREADAEILAPRVVEAFDVPAWATTRVGRDEVIGEFVEGETFAERIGMKYWGDADGMARASAPFTETAAGRRLGLADYVMGNTDRNEGNWIIQADGRIVAIDHGYAFAAQRGTDVPAGFFSEYLMRGDLDPHDPYGLKSVITELTREDVAAVRTRLEALLPEFEAAGRKSWHQNMMRRLREVEKRIPAAT